jgi:catechol-2,3-dioxygenase
MPEIRGVAHILLNVTNPEDTANFYCDVFGFHVSKALDSYGIVSLTHPTANVGLALRRRDGLPATGPQVLDHFAFSVRDREELEEAARHLATLGIEADIEDTVTGAAISLRDPDNNEVEFFAALPGSH